MNTEKNRILTHVETIGNNGTSRLPSLLSKSTVCLSNSKPGKILSKVFSFIHDLIVTIESPLFKRRRTRQKDNLNASTSKIERQTTNLASPTRLPPLNTTNNDGTLKQKADLQRRQVRV